MKIMYGVFSHKGGTKEEHANWTSDIAFALNALGFYDIQVIDVESDDLGITSVYFPMSMRQYRMLLDKGLKLDHKVDEYFFLSGSFVV